MTTATTVPYVDLVAQNASLKPLLLAAVERVLDHGAFVLGREVETFEERFAEYCGTRHAVAVASGTAALTLTLQSLGIGAGDEVITAPNSFVASVSSISLVGAKPVLVDVGADRNIDVAKVEAAITSRTKALLPVHLAGRPADHDRLVDIAGRHDLLIVEDAAQAIGAEHRGRRVGSLGTAGAFSLHPLKNLGAFGDGGMITTNDEQLAMRMRQARNHGLVSRDECEFWSRNERLDAIQAAMLSVKLDCLEDWTETLREQAAFYREHLRLVPDVRVPSEEPHQRAVYHAFVICCEQRDELRRYLFDHCIDTKIHYPVPIHLQPAGRSLGYHEGSFPVAERQANEILSLPIHPHLEPSQIERVVECIARYYESGPLSRV